MRGLFGFTSLLLILAAPQASAFSRAPGRTPQVSSPDCAWSREAAREVLVDRDGLQAIAFEDVGSTVLEGSLLPDSPLVQEFRGWVESQVNPDPLALLKRQRELYSRGFRSQLPNFDFVISGKAGPIEPSSCLEMLLLVSHWKRSGRSEGNLTEFQGFILKGESGAARGRIRAYLVSGDLRGQAPGIPAEVLRAIESDRRSGYRVDSHLHNHPFMLEPGALDIAGTTIPSEADIRSWQSWRSRFDIRQAVITNGFDSLRVASGTFDLFPVQNSY